MQESCLNRGGIIVDKYAIMPLHGLYYPVLEWQADNVKNVKSLRNLINRSRKRNTKVILT